MGHLLRPISKSMLVAAVSALVFAGCIFASAPIKDRPQTVVTPQTGQLSVTSASATPIGDVQPVYVSIANGTDAPRTVAPSQIFAMNEAGGRIAPSASR
jgi:hypothetical protein